MKPPSENWSARTGHIAAALFFMTAAFVLAKTGRDALYFQNDGLLDLPKAYIGIAILSLPVAFGMLGLMQTVGPRPARILAPLLTSVALVSFFPHAEPGGGPTMTLFYMMVPLVFGVLFSLAWLLAADLLEEAPRETLARSYGFVGAASILGGTAGGLVARAIAPVVDPELFLPAAAGALALSSAVMGVAQRRYPLRPIEPGAVSRAPGLRDFGAVLSRRYPVLLLTVAMLASLVGILVEFQFYLAATMSGNDGRENAAFFASFYLVLNGLALVAQIWAMPQLQRRFGVHGSLFVLPLALVAGAGALFANASLVVRSLLRVAEGGLKSSIHRSNWEQAYLPLNRAQRAAAKLLVDGAGARMAEGLGAGMLFLWIRSAMTSAGTLEGSASWLTWVLVGSALAWVGFTQLLSRGIEPIERQATIEGEARLDIPLPDS